METTAYSFEIATIAFSRPMWLLVEKKHDFPRRMPIARTTPGPRAPNGLTFHPSGQTQRGSPLDKWVAAWLGRLEP